MSEPALIVIAKQPRPGHSKTRLTPPCTPSEASALAEAALADTLEAVAAAPASRRLLALEGAPGDWLPAGFTVVAQPRGGLGARLAAAFEAAGGPALLVGMDTPQLTADLLSRSARMLVDDGVDAVLGPAPDGGYWSIGLRHPEARVFERVPMSASDTCKAQRRRLLGLGLRHRMLPALRDVDTIDDARAVAASCRGSRFATTLAGLAIAPEASIVGERVLRHPATGEAAWVGA